MGTRTIRGLDNAVTLILARLAVRCWRTPQSENPQALLTDRVMAVTDDAVQRCSYLLSGAQSRLWRCQSVSNNSRTRRG